jgi:predicted Zn-dependent protease
VVAFVALLLVNACATVPETGRSQLLLITHTQEIEVGLAEFEKLKQSTPVSSGTEAAALLDAVGTRIAAVVPLPNARWEFVLFDEPKIANAFCLPGGKVGVYSGILKVTQDEEGLATVVSHEIAHAVARHGAERVSQGLLTELGGQVLEQAVATQGAVTQQIVVSAYGIGTTVGVMLPYSRRQELEADYLGLIYMARAGYDPRAAIAFWKRFREYNQQQGTRPLAFLSTHPLDQTRIQRLESQLPTALAEYREATGKP